MAAILEIFLDSLAAEKGLLSNSLKAYETDIKQFLLQQNITPEQITAEHISSFTRYLGRQSFAVKTINRKISAVRSFCKFLSQEKIIGANPLPDIDTPKRQKSLPKFLSPAQVKLLQNEAFAHQNPNFMRIGTIIKLMFASGLRVSEILGLPLSAVALNQKQIYVKGKGAKERIVFFDDETKKILEDYMGQTRPHFALKKSVFLFPSQTASDGHLTRDAFFKSLKNLAVECGISPAIISPHTLRHSFATNLINHDADLRSVQKMLGHENISTTEIYTHITPQKIIDSVLKKHPLKNFKTKEDAQK